MGLWYLIMSGNNDKDTGHAKVTLIQDLRISTPSTLLDIRQAGDRYAICNWVKLTDR